MIINAIIGILSITLLFRILYAIGRVTQRYVLQDMVYGIDEAPWIWPYIYNMFVGVIGLCIIGAIIMIMVLCEYAGEAVLAWYTQFVNSMG